MKGPSGDRRRQRHLQTRQEVVEAAWELSRRDGLTGWALRDVAERVGMRAPSLYVYFDSKAALYDAMFADGYRALHAQIAKHRSPDDSRAALRAAARLFVTFAVEDPARFQLLFQRTIPGFEPSPESFALAEQALARTAEVLGPVGLTSATDLDLWTALVTGLASQQISNDPGGSRWVSLVDEAVDRLLR